MRGYVFLPAALTITPILALIACQDQAPLVPEEGGEPVRAKAESPTQSTHSPQDARVVWDLERPFHELSEEIPGYAAHYLDGDDLIILATDPELAEVRQSDILAHPAVEGLLRQHPVAAVRYRRADFSFPELRDARDRLIAMFSQTGVVGLDLEETTNRVRIDVLQESEDVARRAVSTFLSNNGIPSRMVEIEIVRDSGHDRAVTFTPTLNSYRDTLRGGIRVEAHHASLNAACTLGWATFYTSYNDPAFLTATHCSGEWAEVDTTQYSQPNEPFFVGEEIADQTHWDCNDSGPEQCVYADANIVGVYSRPLVWDTQERTLGSGSNVIDTSEPPYTIVGEVTSFVPFRQVVFLTGRNSGTEPGLVSETCVHREPESNRVYLCQVGAEYLSQGGDSGGPVWMTTQDPDEILLAGVHSNYKCSFFSCLRYFSPMSQIRKAFDLLPPLLH